MVFIIIVRLRTIRSNYDQNGEQSFFLAIFFLMWVSTTYTHTLTHRPFSIKIMLAKRKWANINWIEWKRLQATRNRFCGSITFHLFVGKAYAFVDSVVWLKCCKNVLYRMRSEKKANSTIDPSKDWSYTHFNKFHRWSCLPSHFLFFFFALSYLPRKQMVEWRT